MTENMQIKTYITLPEEARAIRETVFADEQGFEKENSLTSARGNNIIAIP